MLFPLIPDYQIKELTELTPELLKSWGIRLLMMDFDNTMLPYSCNTPPQRLLDWIATMQRSDIILCVVSNSKKPRVPVFCAAYGLDCVTHSKKPFSRGIREALRRTGVPKQEAALVGDQIYTDILGGNAAGVCSILVKPIHLSNIFLALRHGLEMPFIGLGRIFAKNRKQIGNKT